MWYNENDPQIVAWLRELLRAGLVPDGVIDDCSIEEVEPHDCAPTSHFFAGIAGWAYALQLAGWPADWPVWTGSCPCQPFSTAGKGGGFDDPRHLWPAWKRLIAQYCPPVVFGEQVAGPLGLAWLAGVRADLEALGYAIGAADLCATGVGSPHIRQRLWWVADAESKRWRRRSDGNKKRGRRPIQTPRSSASCGVASSLQTGRPKGRAIAGKRQASGSGGAGFWGDYDPIPCADGKARRVESGTFPLAHGVPARVVRLRGYGNAIVPQVAAVFVRAYMEARGLV